LVVRAKVADTHRGLTYNDKNDDIDLYGFNANYKLSDKWNTVAEAYFFAKEDKSSDALATTRKSDRVYVPGFRVSTNPMKGLNLQGELAWQRGTDYLSTTSSVQREAMGGQFIASYLLPFEKTAKYEPVVAYAYTYASGDKDTLLSNGNPGAKQKAWDPMFERVSSGKIYNAIFNLTNVHVNELSFSMKPVQDLTTKLTWAMLTLDKKLNDNSGATWTPIDSTMGTYTVQSDKKNLGNEVDLDLTYAYTEDVSIGMSAGWFMPGNVFADNNDKVATQLLTSMTVAF